MEIQLDIHTIDAGTIFADLTEQQKQQIKQRMSLTTYEAGQLFFSPEEYSERLFVLQSGRVRLYKLSPEGRALTLMVLEPVTLFGEMTLVGHWMHDSFAEAMTDCVIGVLHRDVMREILVRYPQVALRFMELMGQRLRDMQNKLANIAFKSVPQRLATVLLNMADLSTTSPFTMPPTVMRYTHQQLAEMIGSYRETVTKAMGDFRAAGLIRIDNEMIYLTNIERLQQLASC